jgi:hypothetical protein
MPHTASCDRLLGALGILGVVALITAGGLHVRAALVVEGPDR